MVSILFYHKHGHCSLFCSSDLLNEGIVTQSKPHKHSDTVYYLRALLYLLTAAFHS